MFPAGHACWISRAAAWIPGSAGQGQPANLPCDAMPDWGSYTYPAYPDKGCSRKTSMVKGTIVSSLVISLFLKMTKYQLHAHASDTAGNNGTVT